MPSKKPNKVEKKIKDLQGQNALAIGKLISKLNKTEDARGKSDKKSDDKSSAEDKDLSKNSFNFSNNGKHHGKNLSSTSPGNDPMLFDADSTILRM